MISQLFVLRWQALPAIRAQTIGVPTGAPCTHRDNSYAVRFSRPISRSLRDAAAKVKFSHTKAQFFSLAFDWGAIHASESSKGRFPHMRCAPRACCARIDAVRSHRSSP